MNHPGGHVQPLSCQQQDCLVRLWWVCLEDAPESLEEQRPYLTAAEWQRAGRFRAEADRRRFVVCRAVLRRGLAARLDTVPERIQLDIEEYGKLRLADEAAAACWSFNVTHSGELGCVALSAGPAVGVDVETARQPMNLELIIDRILTEQERFEFERLPSDQRLPTFLRYWTCKEAIAKATGLGLRLPFAELGIDLRRLGRVVLPDRMGIPASFHLEELTPPLPGYFAAIAIASEQPLNVISQKWTDEAALLEVPESAENGASGFRTDRAT